MDETRRLFEQHQLRVTQQRIALFKALRACKTHPTAEELYHLVKSHTEKLSLATVYNTLEALCASGLARRIPTAEGCCRFDADTTEHMHVRFRETGEIRDVPPCMNAKLMDQLPREVISEIEHHFGIKVDGLNIQLIASSENPTHLA